MNIVEKLFKLSKQAETAEVADAYMIAILYVEDYLLAQKEKEKKEQLKREENALALAAALKELYQKEVK